MTDNELKEIRGKISCPQLGDEHYGEWGILTLNQRRTIKRLLDFVEAQEEYIIRQKAEIERLKESLNIELENYATEYDNKIKAEAYKEFAERLKERKYLDDIGWSHGEHPYVVEESDIDEVLDELVGDET